MGKNGGNGMENRKKTIQQGIICVGLLCVIWGGYVGISNKIVSRQKELICLEQSAVHDLNTIVNIETAKVENGRIRLVGWALRLNSKNENISLVLQPTNGAKAVLFEADTFIREEINELFDEIWEFGECGFEVDKRDKKIEEDVCYEIMLSLEYTEEVEGDNAIKRQKVLTNYYLYENELYPYNPEIFEMPLVDDAELKNVILNGKVRLYSPEHNIWIYQYDRKLYYFWESQYDSLEEENIGIPVIMSVLDKKTEQGKEGEYVQENLGFFFENREYDSEKIQVVVVPLETEKPIGYISTGIYDDTLKEWVYSCYVNLDYEEMLENGVKRD